MRQRESFHRPFPALVDGPTIVVPAVGDLANEVFGIAEFPIQEPRTK
jgi:hypothetical protein